jgi:hypothetical protein
MIENIPGCFRYPSPKRGVKQLGSSFNVETTKHQPGLYPYCTHVEWNGLAWHVRSCMYLQYVIDRHTYGVCPKVGPA